MDLDRVVAAIRKAESASTGEIRVHISHKRIRDAGEAAAKQFRRLAMDRTEQRAAVLIYVAPRARKFAIFGDVGIHERCGDDFWRAVAAGMEAEFRQGRVTEAILNGIERLGETLTAHFPAPPGAAGRNELPDAPTEDG